MALDDEVTIASTCSKCTYRKCGDKLRADGIEYMKGKYRFSFPLSEISAEPIVLKARHPYFRSGLYMAVFGSGAAIVLRPLITEEFQPLVLAISLAFAVCGVVMMIAVRKRIETLTFVNRFGVGLFSVYRDSKNSAEVDRLLSWLGGD